jgi:hypothetical protein
MDQAAVLLLSFCCVALLYCSNSIQHLIIFRKVSGYFFLFVLCLSCSNRKKVNIPEPKIAKTVPANYVNASDSGFAKHQDTIYYQDKYFTGYQFSLYPNGDTEFVKSYFNGVEEGLQKKWYPDKQLAEERFYINGKKEGTHKGWWPDGKQKFIFDAVNNEYSGEFKEWYASGLLGKQFYYINGQEEGSQRLWWDNGTVRANYVIRNGKKYGLIGLKICANPYDSVIKK